MIRVVRIEDDKKGKKKIYFDNDIVWSLYFSEIRSYQITTDSIFDEDTFLQIQSETIGKRGIKRAMHLLEKIDRTKKNLRDKLAQNGYPPAVIDDAIAYLERYHYIDDRRYAENYIRYHQENKSRQRLFVDLMERGVPRDMIEQCIDEFYEADEVEMIKKLLCKKGYQSTQSDLKERQKIYGYLMRRGYKSEDIRRAMNVSDT